MKIPDAYTVPLRTFLSADLKAVRKALGLTQGEMAELLDIEERSYSNLERGESLCSTPVFLRYVFRCKPDPARFLAELAGVLQGVENRPGQ